MKEDYAQIYKSVESIEKHHSKLIRIKQKAKKKRSLKFNVIRDILIFGILLLIRYSMSSLFGDEHQIESIPVTDILSLLMIFGFGIWIGLRYFRYKLEPDDEIEREFLRKDIILLQHQIQKLNNKIEKQNEEKIKQDEKIDEMQDTIDVIPSKETLDVLEFMRDFLQKIGNQNMSSGISIDDKLSPIYDQIDEIHKKLGMFSNKNFYEDTTSTKDDLEKTK